VPPGQHGSDRNAGEKHPDQGRHRRSGRGATLGRRGRGRGRGRKREERESPGAHALCGLFSLAGEAEDDFFLLEVMPFLVVVSLSLRY
jgi:hypothetical protein